MTPAIRTQVTADPGTWTGKNCTDKNNNPCKASGAFGTVQRAFVAGGRSGPLRRVQVFESGLTSSGSNSFETATTHTLGVSLAVTGSLKVQSLATDPIVELRVTGSQNQSWKAVDAPQVSNSSTRGTMRCPTTMMVR